MQQLGHTVKLISPQFVKPYVKGNKTDSRDAEAICEAVSRPHMRFVPRKTVESQDSVVAYFPLCPMPLFSTHGQYALCGSLSHPELARVQPRVDQLDGMAELLQLPRPILCTATRFPPNEARWERRDRVP